MRVKADPGDPSPVSFRALPREKEFSREGACKRLREGTDLVLVNRSFFSINGKIRQDRSILFVSTIFFLICTRK